MKVLAYIGSVLLATVLMVGAGFLLVLTTPRDGRWLTFLAFFAVTTFIYGPLILGSISAFWDTTVSADSRIYFRRYLIGVGIAEGLGVVAIIVYNVVVGAPIWLPILFIVLAAGLFVAGLAVGRSLIRHELAHPRPVTAWVPVSRREVGRKIAIIAITFVVFLVAGLALFLLLGRGDSHRIGETAVEVSLAVEFAFIAAGFACVMCSLSINRRLRATGGGDLGRMRRYMKLVLRRKPIELEESERVGAARYAAIVSYTLAFQLGFIGLLYAGILIQQVQSLTYRRSSPVNVALIVLLVAILVWAIPLTIRRIVLARRYAREHADLLTAEAPEPTPVVE